MTIEIVTIGDELLNGITINTNAAFLSRWLSMQGYRVSRHSVLPDNSWAIAEGLKEALSRASIVITTGGLGPTCDDLTREAAAKIFSSPFHIDAALEKELRERYKDRLKSISDQARVPTKAVLLKNRTGTAPGFLFAESGKVLVLLPGVPQEMTVMVEEQLLSVLPKYFGKTELLKTKMIHLGLLAEDDVDPFLRKLQSQYSQVEFGIYPSHGFLSVRCTSNDSDAIEKCEKKIAGEFSKFLFEAQEGKIERAIQAAFIERKLTLACAESCTGGQVAARLTTVPGASQYFLGSLVTYSDAMKQNFLSVEPKTIQKHGAVSRETVEEMAQGVLKNTGADIGIAVSGIAGPDGGTKEKPVGTVWIGIAKKGKKVESLCLHLLGSREKITLSTTNRMLFFLWSFVVKGTGLDEWEISR